MGELATGVSRGVAQGPYWRRIGVRVWRNCGHLKAFLLSAGEIVGGYNLQLQTSFLHSFGRGETLDLDVGRIRGV